jgi:phytoene dehydrogenase-like protein
MDEAATIDHSLQTHYPVIIVGGGQAGLSMSYCLKERGIGHLVFEKHRLGEAWRSKRWDTFCLVTPNWQCRLPGFDYQGNDPHGFMAKEEIIQYLEAYAQSFDPPLREGVVVSRLRAHESGIFEINSSGGDYFADQVVVATGGYQVETIPRIAERFPGNIRQIHSAEYRNPGSLPEGAQGDSPELLKMRDSWPTVSRRGIPGRCRKQAGFLMSWPSVLRRGAAPAGSIDKSPRVRYQRVLDGRVTDVQPV